MSVGFVTCPDCFSSYPRLSIHACEKAADLEAAQKRFTGAGAVADFTVVTPVGRREQRIAFLERKLAATRADLLLKFEDEDDHGVADAAMDCRDIRNELKGLRY